MLYYIEKFTGKVRIITVYENIKIIRTRNLPLNVHFVGETLCDEKYLIERQKSDVASLEYIVDGEGTLEINGQVLHPKKGDVFYLEKDSTHRYYPDKNNPWHKYFFSISGAAAQALTNLYIPENTYLFVDYAVRGNFERIFDITFDSDSEAEDIQLQLSAEVFKIFTYIYDRRLTQKEDLPDKIKRNIENNVSEEFNLETLCNDMNYSKNHIINIFSSKFKITPYQYYKQCKIKLAKDYLMNTKMTVGEISSVLAFSDQQYFSYFFKKRNRLFAKKIQRSYEGVIIRKFL